MRLVSSFFAAGFFGDGVLRVSSCQMRGKWRYHIRIGYLLFPFLFFVGLRLPVGLYGRLVFLGSSFLVVCLALELAALKSLSGPIARRFRDCARIGSIFCGRFFRADFFHFCLVCRFFGLACSFMF